METLDLSVFPQPDKNDWLKVAEKQLKGEDPYINLSWESYGITQLKPYYDSEDTQDLSELTSFFSQLSPHRWKLYEMVHVLSEKEANKKALAALIGGCDGIIFETKKDFDENTLLKDIDPSICDISVPTSGEKDWITGMNTNNCKVQQSEEQTPAGQIGSLINSLPDSVHWIKRFAFPDFFVEIATIRALRFLVDTLNGRSDIRIHTTIPPHDSEEHQWFLNTSAGLASILGGTHSLDMPTSIGDKRITRNVANIIRDESGIETYTDQCGGSYLVESLTNQIILQVKETL